MIYLKIADRILSLNYSGFKSIETNLIPFLTSSSKTDLEINFVPCDELETISGINISSDNLHLNEIYEEDLYFNKMIMSIDQTNVVAHCHYLKYENKINVYYLKDKFDEFDSLAFGLSKIGFENIVGYLNKIVVHSSFVDYKGNGFLFVGNSGIGKSTRADLWVNEGANIINGDRTILGYFDEWYGYGSPYAGSSKININEKCKIKAIFILNRGHEDEVILENVSEADAIKEIYKNTTIPLWNTNQVHNSIDLIQKIVKEIPIYRITCPPDDRFIQVIKEEMGL